MSKEDLEEVRHLMMAALDDELDPDARSALEARIRADPELEKEWGRLRQVKQTTRELAYQAPPDDIWDDYWRSVYNRVERKLGWLLLSVAGLILFGYGAWHWTLAILEDSGLPTFIQIAVFAFVLGGGILFVSVIREKLRMHRSERYREVQR